MTPQSRRDSFDLLMDSWMDAEGRVDEPADLLDRILERTAKTRRTPGWLVRERWLPRVVGDSLRAVPHPSPLVLVVALLVAALMIVALAVGSRQRLPAPFGPAANGLLVFDTNDQILAASLDGNGSRPLIDAVPNASGPVFSPDGTRFVFWGDGSPDSLYVANADGTGVRRLIGDLWISTDKTPTWSPDSRRVALSTESGPNRLDEYLVTIDTETGVTAAIRSPGLAGIRALAPAWSLDGAWIAFEGIRAAALPSRIPSYFVVRPDGSDPRQLPTSPLEADVIVAHWAPNPARLQLAYSAVGAGGIGSAAYIFDLASNRETRISSGEYAVWPAWSPDGTWLAWLTGTDASGIRIASVDDPLRVRTVPAAGISGPPAWSPDGRYVFGLDRSRTAVVIVAVDGSTSAVAVPHPSSQALPDWQRLAP